MNYLYDLPSYAVSIAATVEDGAPGTMADGRRAVAGAVCDVPASPRLFTAHEGGGSALNGHPIRVSDAEASALSLVATGFGYTVERRTEQAEVVRKLLPRVRDIRRMEAAAVDLCNLAAGRLDAYYERGLAPWDFAARALIARERGAAILSLAEAEPARRADADRRASIARTRSQGRDPARLCLAARGRPANSARLPRTRAPYDASGMLDFLTAHAVPGRDLVRGVGQNESLASSHALDVPGGTALAHLDWAGLREEGDEVLLPVRFELPLATDLEAATAALRRVLDFDADPSEIASTLGSDARLGALVTRRPGLRMPGARNPQEFALGTVLGQQVSLAAARTLQGRASQFACDEPDGAVATAGFVSGPDVAR